MATSDENETNRVLTNMLSSKGSEHLSSYISACREDPDLKSFDSSLHQRTNKVISSLAAPTETQNSPLDSLIKVYKYLFEQSQDMVRIIMESKEDVGKNKELSALVDLYLENTAETLKLFNTVDKFVERAKISQLIIRFAVQQFEAESEVHRTKRSFLSSLYSFLLAIIISKLGIYLINISNQRWCVGGSKKKTKKYEKTLEELSKFKANGDLLGEEFATHYKSVLAQQVKLLGDLCEQKGKLDKKLKKVKKLKYFSYAFFGTAVASVLIVSIVSLAAVSAPLAAGAAHHLSPLAAAQLAQLGQLARPIASTGTWVSELLNKYEKNMKTHKDMLTSTEEGTKVNKGATETINFQVEDLRGRISLIMRSVDFAVERDEEEEATRLAMQEIVKNVEEFTKKIEEVGETAAKLSKLIVLERVGVLERIANSKGK